RRTQSSGHEGRTREQARAEDDLQQITVELKPKCDIEIVVPDVAAAGQEHVQRRKSREAEQGPTDERSWVYSPLHYNTQIQSVSDEESD
ncbi:Phosphatidylinositol-4-phosphate 5-kinase type-1 gamma, partial [Ophiophagus hannah]